MIFPEKALFSNEQILSFLPHRTPMVFVDAFYGLIGDNQYASLTITEDMLLVENGRLLDVGIIEFLAQSGYVWFSYREKVLLQKSDMEITKGYLCKMKNVHILERPAVGTRIFSKMEVAYYSDSFCTIHLSAYNEKGLLAEGDFDVISMN